MSENERLYLNDVRKERRAIRKIEEEKRNYNIFKPYPNSGGKYIVH